MTTPRPRRTSRPTAHLDLDALADLLAARAATTPSPTCRRAPPARARSASSRTRRRPCPRRCRRCRARTAGRPRRPARRGARHRRTGRAGARTPPARPPRDRRTGPGSRAAPGAVLHGHADPVEARAPRGCPAPPQRCCCCAPEAWSSRARRPRGGSDSEDTASPSAARARQPGRGQERRGRAGRERLQRQRPRLRRAGALEAALPEVLRGRAGDPTGSRAPTRWPPPGSSGCGARGAGRLPVGPAAPGGAASRPARPGLRELRERRPAGGAGRHRTRPSSTPSSSDPAAARPTTPRCSSAASTRP
jgi:hypothetical protein